MSKENKNNPPTTEVYIYDGIIEKVVLPADTKLVIYESDSNLSPEELDEYETEIIEGDRYFLRRYDKSEPEEE